MYSFIEEGFIYKPLDIIKCKFTSSDFFVVDENSINLDTKDFNSNSIEYCNKISYSSLERNNANIEISLIKGKIQNIIYQQNNKVYANSIFDNNTNSIIKSIDKDDDGIFEVTEKYLFNVDFENQNKIAKESPLEISKEISKEISIDEQKAYSINIFGIENIKNIFLENIEIDTNLDTLKDFSVTNNIDGSVTTKWDTDFNGEYDIVYNKFIDEQNKNFIEEYSYLIKDLDKPASWIVIKSIDGNPVSIKDDEQEHLVTKGINQNFYWIASEPNEGYELNILGQISLYDNAQSFLIECAGCDIKVIKVSNKIYAKIIQREFMKDILTDE